MHDPHIVSREVHLKERPLGLPKASDLEIVSVSLPRDVHERILIRNRYFVISPSLRLMISDGAEAMPGIPFPVLARAIPCRARRSGRCSPLPRQVASRSATLSCT